jgi:hypothetical protein
LALVVETLAHGILKDAGRHHSKEYFAATEQECREAISISISRCGATEELIRTKELIRINGEKKATKAKSETLRRSERRTAMCTAFLVETIELRKEMHSLADKIDQVHETRRGHGLIKSLFSSEAKNLGTLLDEHFKEMRTLVLKFRARKVAFSVQNKTAYSTLYTPNVQIDSYDEMRFRNNSAIYGLNRRSLN